MEFEEEDETSRKALNNAKGGMRRGPSEDNVDPSGDATDNTDKPQRVSVISAADHVTNLTPKSPGKSSRCSRGQC